MAVFSYHGGMAIPMSKTIKEERVRWILPIARREIKLVDVARVCPYGKRSLERWLAAYKQRGEVALEPRSTARKTQENETPIRIKERIIEVRKQTKKCALKLHWRLKKEGLVIPPRTIGNILLKTFHSASEISIPFKFIVSASRDL